MTEFDFKKNVKVVVNFYKGEKVVIVGYGPDLDGIREIIDFKENYGGCQSGIMAKVKGHNSWLDIGWFIKTVQ